MFLKEFKKKGVNNGNILDCRIGTSIEVWAKRAIMGAMEIMNFEFWIGHELQARASGGVIGNELREGNVWETYEKNKLLNNNQVTSIEIIDPKTKKSKGFIKGCND